MGHVRYISMRDREYGAVGAFMPATTLSSVELPLRGGLPSEESRVFIFTPPPFSDVACRIVVVVVVLFHHVLV